MAQRQIVLLFNEEKNLDPALRGNKGRGLAEMAAFGLPIPPGFTISTGAARAYSQTKQLPNRLTWQLERGIAALEQATGKRFGDRQNPLLVSVRSGAKVSMPGMMDSILNLGLTWATVKELARTNGKHFAYDIYRRFLAMYGEAVFGVSHAKIESALNHAKMLEGVMADQELSVRALKWVCQRYTAHIEDAGGHIPDDPREQLHEAICAVFRSWESPRAIAYRKTANIPDWWGTAANVQAMVFGNRGDTSCTGVAFSHDISTGKPGLYGEFLVNAQGEDVVSGTRTPMSITHMRNWNASLYEELEAHICAIEERVNDAVEIEFTVEEGRLFILQYRVAKRTPEAAVFMAVRRVWAKRWSKERALQEVSSKTMDEAAQGSRFDPATLDLILQEKEPRRYAEGLAVSPGAVSGKAVFTSTRAVELARAGECVVLIRPDTAPEDLPGMLVSSAIATAQGGISCHAAVVARGLGKPCVVSLKGFYCDADEARMGPDTTIHEGDVVSVDGARGLLVVGKASVIGSDNRKETNILFRWANRTKPMLPLPKPRIDFEAESKRYSANKLLTDFYCVRAMALAAKGTELEQEAAQLWNRTQVEIAETFACYLLLAVAGELRHTPNNCCVDAKKKNPDTCPLVEYQILQERFGVLDDCANRRESQSSVVRALMRVETAQHIEFFRLAKKIFCNYPWSLGLGGAKWGAIAGAALAFLAGDVPHALFIDHVFDLEHNGGRLFDKHAMVSRTDEYDLRLQLETKKSASDAVSVITKLRSTFFMSPESELLWEKGIKLGIWTPPAAEPHRYRAQY